MEFSRIGKHTIRCVISEEEIMDMGFSLEEIMSNGERTQEFMNLIFDMAEERFETKFELGIKTVRADFMSDHTLSLTFSEHPGAEDMMEHLKDIISGLMNSIPQQKWEEIQAARENQMSSQAEEVQVIVVLVFEDMDILIRFAKQVAVTEMPPSALYKYKNKYYLIVDFTNMEEEDVKCLSPLTDEYVSDILVGAERKAFIEEHGELIAADHAIEKAGSL